MTQGGWRKWHRWAGAVAAPFLLFVAVTGVALAATEWFGEDEARRERLREVDSAVTTQTAVAVWQEPVRLALLTVAREAPDAPLDKLTVEFKGEPPTVTAYTSRRHAGGEDRKFVCDARTGELLRVERYADKPFLVRLHSGEAVGDWGLGFAILWGTALAGLTVSGVVIYLLMRKPGATGRRRIFW